MPNGAPHYYYLALGDGADIAAGMLLTHPMRTKEICAAIAISNSSYDPEGRYKVMALANALGVDENVARVAIAQAEFKHDVAAKKAIVEKTYSNPNSTPEMGM